MLRYSFKKSIQILAVFFLCLSQGQFALAITTSTAKSVAKPAVVVKPALKKPIPVKYVKTPNLFKDNGFEKEFSISDKAVNISKIKPIAGKASLQLSLKNKKIISLDQTITNLPPTKATSLIVSAKVRPDIKSTTNVQLCGVATYSNKTKTSKCVTLPKTISKVNTITVSIPLVLTKQVASIHLLVKSLGVNESRYTVDSVSGVLTVPSTILPSIVAVVAPPSVAAVPSPTTGQTSGVRPGVAGIKFSPVTNFGAGFGLGSTGGSGGGGGGNGGVGNVNNPVTVPTPFNSGPIVSEITADEADVDAQTSGFQLYPGTVVYSAAASDANDDLITWTWYYSTGSGNRSVYRTGTGTVQPISFSYPSAGVSYKWTLAVSDGKINVEKTIDVSIVAKKPVITPPVNALPIVELTAPIASIVTAPANLSLVANASDTDGSIAKVEFYQSTIKLGEDISAPYTFSWVNVPAGVYGITARAFDNANAFAVSPVVNVTVVAPTPIPVNGSCGTSNNTTVSTAPTTNLCGTGTASLVSGSGPWSWTCAGSNGGTTASCSAQKAIASSSTTSATYRVGPNKQYTQLTQVANLLQPGDIVEVDGNATYQPVSFNQSGTASKPIVIRGVRINGNRPVISGGSNTVRFELSNFNTIEGFDIRGGVDRCVFIHAGDIILRDIAVHDCARHGILGADTETGSITLDHVEVYRAGSQPAGENLKHPIYVTTDEELYPNAVFRMQYSYIHDNNGGEGVKSRARRNEIYYNWIQASAGAVNYYQMSLYGPDADSVTPVPGIREDGDVVGNVFVGVAGSGVGSSVRLGGDTSANSSEGRYRFANNTFVTFHASPRDFFRVYGTIESIELNNNVFYSANNLTELVNLADAVWTHGQVVSGRNNWISQTVGSLTSGLTATIRGTNPGFVDNSGVASLDPQLLDSAPIIDNGTANNTDSNIYPVPSPLALPQYIPAIRLSSGFVSLQADTRLSQGAIDIGAFEYVGTPVGTTPITPVDPVPPPPSPVNGICGSANNTTVSTVPTTNLCSVGTASSVIGSGPWTWSCAGLNGGTTDSCVAQKTPVQSVSYLLTTTKSGSGAITSVPAGISCGTTCSASFADSTSVVLVATPAVGSIFTGWNGACSGTGSCTVMMNSAKSVGAAFAVSTNLVNGSCGTSNNTTVSTAPTTNLCGTGTASLVSGSGPWTWTCAGSNGGATASCSAQKTVTSTSTADSYQTSYGFSIPKSHPRLWFDATRLAQARTWLQSHPINPDALPESVGTIQRAMNCVVLGDAASCRAAIDYAMSITIPPPTNVSCDYCRWYGEVAILTYDWAYNYMTVAERSTFLTRWNGYLSGWMTKPWGGVGMEQNNYYWGNLRNELEWGITSFGDSSQADTFLTDALVTRWKNSFIPAAANGSKGGVAQEGAQYGTYLLNYPIIPFKTVAMNGRDIYNETDFSKSSVYFLIYNTTPVPTSMPGGATGFSMFPWNDDEFFRQGGIAEGVGYGDLMLTMANQWSNLPVGQYARQWINMTGALNYGAYLRPQGTRLSVTPWTQSLDNGGTAKSFSSLPLDYYASGPGMMFGRSSWANDATLYHQQLKELSGVGHSHEDYGNWQLWRGGRWLSRETTAYSENFIGYGGSGTAGSETAIAHNTLLVNGRAFGTGEYKLGPPVVRRLESQSGYSFTSVDLSKMYRAVNRDQVDNPAVNHVERDMVFIRPLETLVIFDRVESNATGGLSAESIKKTFLAHFETSPSVDSTNRVVNAVNGTQALRISTLVPSNPTYRVVAEGGQVGQYRLELETSGSAQSYFLNVLQAKDASGTNLVSSVVDNGTSYTVTLAHPQKGTVTLVLNKGMISSGGSITIGGATTPLNNGVQSIGITENGPVWGALNGTPVPVPEPTPVPTPIPTPTPSPINGACGSANNTTVSTAPTTNLCSAGTASTVSGSGPWTWTCAGSNGGITASCSAQKTVVPDPTPVLGSMLNTNLITDPGFESGVAGFTSDGATNSRVTVSPIEGQASLQIVSDKYNSSNYWSRRINDPSTLQGALYYTVSAIVRAEAYPPGDTFAVCAYVQGPVSVSQCSNNTTIPVGGQVTLTVNVPVDLSQGLWDAAMSVRHDNGGPARYSIDHVSAVFSTTPGVVAGIKIVAGPNLGITRQLKYNSRGEDVAKLQTFLEKNKFLQKGLPRGLFRNMTRDALKKYQISAGLEQTGMVDVATLEKLNSK